MMGILCTEQSCSSCKCCGIIWDSFHSDDGKLLSWDPFLWCICSASQYIKYTCSIIFRRRWLYEVV